MTLILEMFSNIIQYQYAGNAHLVYAIVRRKEVTTFLSFVFFGNFVAECDCVCPSVCFASMRCVSGQRYVMGVSVYFNVMSCLCICLFVCLFVCVSVCWFVCLFVWSFSSDCVRVFVRVFLSHSVLCVLSSLCDTTPT